MIKFPVTLRMNSALLDDFRECELGSYEDYTRLKESGDPDDFEEAGDMIYGDVHRYDILGRKLNRKKATSTIVMEDADEVAEVYYAACSGTFQCYEEGRRSAIRIANQLRPILQENEDYRELLRMWAAPHGY